MEPKDRIPKLIAGKWLERPLLLCCKLGIPDIIGDRELSIEEISKQTNSHAEYRVIYLEDTDVKEIVAVKVTPHEYKK